VRFTGQFVNLWGVTDVAAFGDTVVTLSPEGDHPLKRVTWLTVEDADTLRMTKTNGYGAPGETLRYVRDGEGHAAKIVMGGVSLYLAEGYRARQ
jgi:hypothetical protein